MKIFNGLNHRLFNGIHYSYSLLQKFIHIKFSDDFKHDMSLRSLTSVITGSNDNQFPMEWMTSKLHGKEHGSDGQGLLGGARVCFLSKFSRLI